MEEERQGQHTIPLHQAVANNDCKAATLLIEQGAKVHDMKLNGERAIHIAVRNASTSLVKILLAAGANVKHRVVGKDSVLHLAAKTGSVEVAEILISAGASVNAKNNCGTTALHHAVAYNKDQMVICLLKHGCDVDAKDTNGETALHYAASYEYINDRRRAIMKILLEQGADANKQNQSELSPFHMIVKRGDKAMVSLFLDHQADITITNVIAFQYALCNEDSEVLEFILESEVDIDKKNSNIQAALDLAGQSNSPKYIRQLVAKGADVNNINSLGVTPLYWSVTGPWKDANRPNARKDRFQVIQLLLELGSDLNLKLTYSPRTLFEILIKDRKIEEVKMMIKHVAKVEARTNKQLLDANNMRLINEHSESKIYYEKCQAELASMKENKIGNTRISYYSIMEEPLQVVAIYARNQELVQAFESDYRVAFPIYQAQLRAKFDEGVDEQKRFQKASTILSEIMNFADPSHVVIEKILRCLTREDIDIING